LRERRKRENYKKIKIKKQMRQRHSSNSWE